MESNAKMILDAFFEEVRTQCLIDLTKPIVATIKRKDLASGDVEDIEDYLEDLALNDDYDYEVCTDSIWDPVIGETLYYRKSIAYDLSVDYDRNDADNLLISADFHNYYEKYGWGDIVEISEEEYNAALKRCNDDDEYSGDLPCEMHYVGNGAWCDDDGDNWDFL